MIFPPVWAHWVIMKCGYLWFIFVSFCYALFFPPFFCGYFGNMALWVPPGDYDREGFMNTIETRFPNSKEETRLSCYSDWYFMGKVNWDPTIITVTVCIRYYNSVATTICVAKTLTFFSSFLRLCHFGTISMIFLSIMKLKPPKIRKRN